MSKQIFPPTIMETGFAAGGSVLDHNFGKSDPYTLGVEEEYMLLDGETLDLVQHVEAVLEAAHGEVFGSVLPASAFVVVKGLLDPRWRVELEAEALVP